MAYVFNPFTGNMDQVNPLVTDWVAYTPKTTGLNFSSSPTFSKTFWRRVGDSMEIKGSVTSTAADGNAQVVQMDVIPTGYTVDTTKIAADQAGPVGTVKYIRAGVGAYYGVCLGRSTGTINFGTSFTINAFVATSIQVNDFLSWHCTIPITEFA